MPFSDLLMLFYSTSQSRCLLDHGNSAGQLDHSAEGILPGERFDADQQCKLVKFSLVISSILNLKVAIFGMASSASARNRTTVKRFRATFVELTVIHLSGEGILTEFHFY